MKHTLNMVERTLNTLRLRPGWSAYAAYLAVEPTGSARFVRGVASGEFGAA